MKIKFPVLLIGNDQVQFKCTKELVAYETFFFLKKKSLKISLEVQRLKKQY